MMVRYNKNPNVLFFKNLSKIKKDDPTITEEEKDEIIKNRHGYWRNSIGFNISHIGLDKSSIKKSENTKKKTKRGIKKTFSFSFLKISKYFFPKIATKDNVNISNEKNMWYLPTIKDTPSKHPLAEPPYPQVLVQN